MVVNMFRKRKEEDLRKKLDKIEKELQEERNDVIYYRDSYHKQRMFYLSKCKEVEDLSKELEKQKAISAEHISRYYDTIQKLKTVMEETNYGKDL